MTDVTGQRMVPPQYFAVLPRRAPAPWSANASNRPNVFFQVGAACCLSECAVAIVASMFAVIRTRVAARRALAGQSPGALAGHGASLD